MKISERLRVIGDLVDDNSFILDIGCDHALLDIYAVLSKKNVKAIASDINEKPLEKAKENVKKYNLENKIKIVQSDGLDSCEDGVDTVILSGLGSTTIVDILIKGNSYLQNVNKIIISSNNDYYYLRYNVNKLGYCIDDEKIVYEKGKYYPIIVFKKDNKKYNKFELKYGPVLLKNKDDVFNNYLKEEKSKLINIHNSLGMKYLLKKIKIKKEIININKNSK